MFGYFQVFSKDNKKYDLNQFLVAVSNRFMRLHIFISLQHAGLKSLLPAPM